MVAQNGARRRRSGGDDVLALIKEQASEVTGLVKTGARRLKDQAAEQAKQLGRVVRDEADRLVHDQKIRTATKIQSMGSAAQKAARFLHAGKVEGVAEYVDMAARAADQASKYLDERELGEMADDLGELAKRQPGAVFGGLFLAGLIIGRFIRAGNDNETEQGESEEEE